MGNLVEIAPGLIKFSDGARGNFMLQGWASLCARPLAPEGARAQISPKAQARSFSFFFDCVEFLIQQTDGLDDVSFTGRAPRRLQLLLWLLVAAHRRALFLPGGLQGGCNGGRNTPLAKLRQETAGRRFLARGGNTAPNLLHLVADTTTIPQPLCFREDLYQQG